MTEKSTKTCFRIAVDVICVVFMPIACVGIGAGYIDRCPVEKNLPIGLIVLGVFTALQGLFLALPVCKSANIVCICFHTVSGVSTMSALIAESIFLYPNYWKFDEFWKSENYCDPNLYRLAFWYTNFIWFAIILSSCFFCVAVICGVISIRKAKNTSVQSNS